MRIEEQYLLASMAGDECFEFVGSKMVMGYGHSWLDGQKILAHRAVFCLHEGRSIESIHGVVVRHACDFTSCINPRHLSDGTCKQNSEDMVERMRSPFGTRNGSAILTEEQVLRIRSECVPRSRTAGCSRFAEEFGVSCQAVWDVVARRRWRYLDRPTQ